MQDINYHVITGDVVLVDDTYGRYPDLSCQLFPIRKYMLIFVVSKAQSLSVFSPFCSLPISQISLMFFWESWAAVGRKLILS